VEREESQGDEEARGEGGEKRRERRRQPQFKHDAPTLAVHTYIHTYKEKSGISGADARSVRRRRRPEVDRASPLRGKRSQEGKGKEKERERKEGGREVGSTGETREHGDSGMRHGIGDE
jgi:hypothetical protein